MPLLEHRREDCGLDLATARTLVAFALSPAWSEYWASKALDWVEDGVWDDDIADALRRCSQDKRYSQRTRHRAYRQVETKNEGH